MGFFNKKPILKKEDARLPIIKILGIVLLILLLIVIIKPSVVFSSWWNPSSWKIFQRTDIKTQVLEKRILELESKLNIATTTNSTSTLEVNATTTSVINSEEKKVITKNATTTSATNIDEEKVTKKIEPNTSVPTVDIYAKYRDPVTGKVMTPTEWVDYYDKKCASQDKVRSTAMNSDGTISCITYTQACQAKFGINSYSSGDKECNCTEGYAFDSNNKCSVIDYNALCQKKYGVNSYSTGKNSSGINTCGCKTGYFFNQSGSCQLKQTTDYNNAPYRQDGNAYSPAQLNAMDCAWYGINCPTINVRILN
ncbi:MAG: hypothetical protein WCK37_03675 [Candidatus Falkowbacteria bacterium]